MNPRAFCQVYFYDCGFANSRVFWLHICLGISVVLGFFYKLLFLFHIVGVCTHALMLKVLWDPSSFEGSHEMQCNECFIELGTIVQGIVY
jgi:hypothetical protein